MLPWSYFQLRKMFNVLHLVSGYIHIVPLHIGDCRSRCSALYNGGSGDTCLVLMVPPTWYLLPGTHNLVPPTW